ncbi:hypothetical protein LOZ57_000364 [Ophidiomyces ophidiicola]|uniref:uncharacterized protein n=1 Tax=Ophidiomyces ophidiicola TaxID=1387563 RepID=UPI0020C2D781
MPPRRRDDNWVDGVRGVASLIVVTGHLCSSFAPYLQNPALAENGPIGFWQLPFLRLAMGGRGAVALFFVITGFVNSLSTVKSARAANTHAALTGLARSSFTRSGRLVLPTSSATVIAWFLTQIGAFQLAKRVDAGWIRNVGHDPDPFAVSLLKLLRSVTIYWSSGGGEYDATHWPLPFFLHGSFRIYVALLAMILVAPRYWWLITSFLYVFSWVSSDYLIGTNIFAGMLIAQLHVDYGSRATSMLPKIVPSILIILGLFLWCIPQDNPHWALWSRIMQNCFAAITPRGSETNKYCSSVGVTLLMLGIFFSKNARKLLTTPFFNFLGRVSYPVYLLHNSLIRTILVWMIYGPNAAKTPLRDDKGKLVEVKRAGPLAFVFAIPTFYAVLYMVSWLWTKHVDPACASVVDWMKDLMFLEEEKQPQEKPLPLTQVT